MVRIVLRNAARRDEVHTVPLLEVGSSKAQFRSVSAQSSFLETADISTCPCDFHDSSRISRPPEIGRCACACLPLPLSFSRLSKILLGSSSGAFEIPLKGRGTLMLESVLKRIGPLPRVRRRTKYPVICNVNQERQDNYYGSSAGGGYVNG
ncbi:hypothetical protein V1478_007045 [Vespula squamosa]|uniref:Uncharacterized protein n=1 Tax=Vespula squamosa TaxID=30214 RepID=A0ABD2B219_VESSQ